MFIYQHFTSTIFVKHFENYLKKNFNSDKNPLNTHIENFNAKICIITQERLTLQLK